METAGGAFMESALGYSNFDEYNLKNINTSTSRYLYTKVML